MNEVAHEILNHLDRLTNTIGELQVVIESKQQRQVWLSKKQACERLGIGKTKLNGLIASGRLPSNRLDGSIRIHVSDIDSLVRFSRPFNRLKKVERKLLRELR